MQRTTGRVALVFALGVPLGGCYSGFQEFGGELGAEGFGPGADDGEGNDGGPGGDGTVAEQCLDAPREIGATSLRRLTQSEYEHTIEQLLGLSTDVAAGFSSDERVGPFKSNAIAAVSDIQVEQYMDAAEVLADEYVTSMGGQLSCEAADDACAEQWLRDMMPRVYRRPATDADISGMMAVYADAAAEDGFEAGVQLMMQTMLQSPWFLYHVERGESPSSDGPHRLTGHELASRLSYFLWDSMPDDELFDAAASGALNTDEGILAQVDRMLADPRAEAAVADFHLQWLGLDELETLEKDTTTYPDFDASLASAMKADTAAFVRWVFSEGDGKLSTLLTGGFTLTEDPALLNLYGVERPSDLAPGTPLPLPGDQRSGILTQPSVMAWYGHADQSSPVHRGKMVRENVLCQILPPPPEDVDDVPPDPRPGATTRERFQEHTSNESCAACHQLIDGLGFGFESYDGIGAFRTVDQDLPVDATGEVISTKDIDGKFDGAIELSERLASSADVQACVARQWFRYSLGRLDQGEDSCGTHELTTRFADSDYEVRSLIQEIALSDAFRYRRNADESAVITEGE